MWDMIQTFLSSSTTPKILKEIEEHIYKCSNVRVPIHLIRQYIKEKLGMSYKIGKSRPMLFDTERNMLIKWYFTVRIAHIIEGIDLIVNIDEASFSRSLKRNRSWLKRGVEDVITNIKYSGSLSLISAITSSGSSFHATVSGWINSSLFMKFMVELTNFLKRHHGDELEKVLILLDNAPSHRAKTIKDYFKASETSVIFLPPYSPELAPVEKYFSILKNLVSKDKCQNTMSWKTEKGIDLIEKNIQKIDASTTKRLWWHFFRELNTWMDHMRILI